MADIEGYKEIASLVHVEFDKFDRMVREEGWDGLEHFDLVMNILLRAQHNKAIGMPDSMIWLHIMTLCGDSNLVRDEDEFMDQRESLGESLFCLLEACEDKYNRIPDFIIWLNVIENSGIAVPWDSLQF